MPPRITQIQPVLVAHDVMDSVAFYRKLGFALAFQDSASNPKYAGVVRDDIEIHLQWADPGQWAHPTDRPAYRFLVSDVDALHKEFVASGCVNPATTQGSPWAAPADTPWGTREFHLWDPGRNSLQFYQPAAQAT